MQVQDSIPYYDHHAGRLHQEWLREKSPADLVPFLELLKPRSLVLDLGAGNGMDLNWIMKAGHEAVGIEGSQQLLEAAKVLNPSLKMMQKNLMFLTLREAEYDGIWANDVFQHFPSELVQRMVATCFRGLKPGGVLGAVISEGSGSFEDRQGDLSGPSRSIFLYSEKAICSLIEQTGFQIKKIGRKNDPSYGQKMLVLATRI